MPETQDTQLVADFLDAVIKSLGLKNDAALARTLKVLPPAISKLRHGLLNFGALYILKTHKVTGWTVLEIEAALGVGNEFAEQE